MQILLIGSTGQVGAAIQAQSVAFPEVEIIIPERSQVDLANPKSLFSALDQYSFDVLFNAAAIAKPDKVEQDHARALAINSYAVVEMAKLCQHRSALFCQVSTDYVFGQGHDAPLDESTTPAPVNLYGMTKFFAETLAQVYAEKTVIFRTASILGHSRGAKEGNFIERMLKAAQKQSTLSVVADQWMSPTTADDFAKMILLALQKNISPGVYHAVNTGSASWYELLDFVFKTLAVDCRLTPAKLADFPASCLRPHYSVLTNHKLAGVIGPIREWRSAVIDYLGKRE